MKLIAIIAFLALLIMPCIAVPDSVTNGPYKVKFDLGLPHNVYNITVTDPIIKETLGGDEIIEYSVDILVVQNESVQTARIGVKELESFPASVPASLIGQTIEQSLKELDGNNPSIFNFRSDTRAIDGASGAITSGDFKVANDVYTTVYHAMYLMPSDPTLSTLVEILSTLPWEEGTLSLLKTIHVEKIR